MTVASPLILDVRPILMEGGEPFSDIMAAADRLAANQELKLLAPFKPVPLFAVMESRGFDHREQPIGGGDWEVVFTSRSAAEPVEDAGAAPAPTLDTRGLEPPEPLERVLATLEGMAAGARLEVYTEREPVFLYRALAERGHSIESKALGQDGFRHLIRHSGSKGQG